jgi:integrase
MNQSELYLLLPELPNSERLERWARAFHEWLEGLRDEHGIAVRTQALRAWKLLMQFRPGPPWEIDRGRMEVWMISMSRNGYKGSTIGSYKGWVTNFFLFCTKCPELMDSESMLGTASKPINPVYGAARPEIPRYSRAYILRAFEARALLMAVDRQSGPLAKRDYAILLTMLLTGLPEHQLRRLRWGDFKLNSKGAVLNDGSPHPGKEIPAVAWEAIVDHLTAAGRLQSIEAGDYVFAALAEPLLQPPISGRAEAWKSDRPISIGQLYACLKMYATWAGLDAAKVTSPCLRHTAAALYLQRGADEADLMKFLERRTLRETRRYIGKLGLMLAKRKRRRRGFIPGIDQPGRGPYQRKRPGGQPGNQFGMRHGFYSQALPDATPEEAQAAANASLEDEIIAIRLLLQRAIRLAERTSDAADAMRMLDVFGRTCERLSRLLRAQQKQHLDLKSAILSSAINEALEEVTKELRLE